MLIAMSMSSPTRFGDRLPPIASDKLTDAQEKAIEQFSASRRTGVFGPFIPLLRSPELMVRVGALGEHLRYGSSLPPRLSEFVILLTARRWTQNYEWFIHEPIALEAGVHPATIKSIADGQRPENMNGEEEILYDFFDELHCLQMITDSTYAGAVARLGEQGIIDTTAMIGYYTMLAMVMNTARTPLPDGVKPAFPSSPGSNQA